MTTILEAEVKAKAPEDIEEKLIKLGARKKAEEHQKDIYYDHDTKVLRVREQDNYYILTLKESIKSENTKLRKEIEAECKGKIKQIIKGLGYEPEYYKEKHRKEYDLDGANICVDDVKHLGKYIEVEVLAENAEEAEKKVERTLEKLGVSPEKAIKESYIELLGDKKKEKSWD